MLKRLLGYLMNNVISVLKVILFEFVVSVVFLLILAFFMYRVGLSQATAKFMILGIYLVSTFLGGMIMAKTRNCRRLLWGMAAGVIYLLVLLLVSMILHTEYTGVNNLVLSILCCILGGALGGMCS
ncbi:MAG: TIGR04086 family membrane protein [Lachnospiraceae bacterium]